ncbi:hypothetical protein LCGC14_1711670, partial [marine sediment metagenome]
MHERGPAPLSLRRLCRDKDGEEIGESTANGGLKRGVGVMAKKKQPT